MEYIHLKNYRSIENSEFLIGNINFLIGDNNTGKTSLLKLIEFLNSNETLDFKNTYFEKFSTKDLKNNENKPIKIFNAWFKKRKSKKAQNKMHFQYMEIDSYLGTDNDELNNDPIIKKLISSSPELDQIYFVELEYMKLNNVRRKYIKKINIKIFDNIFKKITEFEQGINLINILNKYVKDSENILSKKEEKFSEQDIKENLKNSSDKLDNDLDKEFSKLNKKERDLRIIKHLENHNKYLLVASKNKRLKIENLLIYVQNFIFSKKNKGKSIDLFYRFNFLHRKYNYFEKNKDFKYIEPIREIFKKLYLKGEEILGEKEINELFANDKFLAPKINDFFRKTKMLDSVDFLEQPIEHIDTIIPVFNKLNKKNMKLHISGTGISQVLPILISVYREMKPEVIYIEQPELHLHPRAQSLLGEVFYEVVDQNIKNLKEKKNLIKNMFIETHSMYLLNNFRYEIFENNKDSDNWKNDFAVIWFFKNEENKVSNLNIQINKKGKYLRHSNELNNFFINESLKLLKMR